MKQEIIDVGTREWKETSSPNIIKTVGLGPCIAIGIYDTRRKLGYMIHQDSPANDVDNNVIKFLNHVLKKSKIEDLKVYVTGGEPPSPVIGDDDYEVEEDDIEDQRGFVEAQLIIFSNAQKIVKWNNHKIAVDLILDTRTGFFTIEKGDECYFDENTTEA